MDSNLSDKEQIAILKQWWVKYGMPFVLALLIGAVLSVGWRYWKRHETVVAERASVVYEQMLVGQQRNQMVLFKQAGDELINKYSGSTYADLAALLMAKQAAEKGDYTHASKHLQWVIGHAHSDTLQQIARLRAARILITTQKPQQALKLLSVVSNKTFLPAIEAVQAEAYTALGNIAQARKAYQTALSALPKDATIRPLLQMKFEQLASS